jgi:alpha-L-fucosidase 2
MIADGISGDHETIPGSVRFRVLIDVQADGACYALNDRLMIFSSSNVTLRLVIATSFINYSNVNGDEVQLADNFLSSCLSRSYSELLQRHLTDHQSLFNRVQLNIGESPAMLEPTNLRIKQFPSDPTKDPQLMALLFQYGRYLLIASSRPGGQAANIQAIWNDQMNPTWQSKYTTNINVEMNYWPAGPANLIECLEPLFDLISGISQTGQITAQRHYGTVKSFLCSLLIFNKE